MNAEGIKKELIETFENVKEVVRRKEGKSRAGLMLGLQDLGASMSGFVGAYYPVESNIIVVNTTPLKRIMETEPNLLKPYIFHILLHEYIHSLGVIDENQTRYKTYDISRREFGESHIVTELSKNMEKHLKNMVYPTYGWLPQEASNIELVKGFDKSSYQSYIT
jgi:hypothetical protein